MTDPIEVRDASRRFRSAWALRDCNLSVRAGSVTGLVGANGAGKSTLLHLVVGLLAPTTGAVSVFGAAPGRAEVLARVGFVAQDAPLPRRLSVGDVMRAGAALNPGWDQTIVEEHVAALAVPRRRLVGSLSGGQRARLALALALGKRPDLLLLDEPVASLDPLARREFLGSLMAAVAEDGLTVVYSTHLLDDLQRACDHLVVLVQGAVRVDGSIDDIVAGHRILTGSAEAPLPAGVVATSRCGRHATALVAGRALTHPAWVTAQPTLDEIVLAYLSSPAPHALQAVS